MDDLLRTEDELLRVVRAEGDFLTEIASHLIKAGGKRVRPPSEASQRRRRSKMKAETDDAKAASVAQDTPTLHSTPRSTPRTAQRGTQQCSMEEFRLAPGTHRAVGTILSRSKAGSPLPDGWCVEVRQEASRAVRVWYSPGGARFRSLTKARQAAERNTASALE